MKAALASPLSVFGYWLLLGDLNVERQRGPEGSPERHPGLCFGYWLLLSDLIVERHRVSVRPP